MAVRLSRMGQASGFLAQRQGSGCIGFAVDVMPGLSVEEPCEGMIRCSPVAVGACRNPEGCAQPQLDACVRSTLGCQRGPNPCGARPEADDRPFPRSGSLALRLRSVNLMNALAEKGCNRVLWECVRTWRQRRCVKAVLEVAAVVAPKLRGNCSPHAFGELGFTAMDQVLFASQPQPQQLGRTGYCSCGSNRMPQVVQGKRDAVVVHVVGFPMGLLRLDVSPRPGALDQRFVLLIPVALRACNALQRRSIALPSAGPA